jgi:lipoprotein NlpD
VGACADGAAYGPQSYVVRPEDTLYSIAWRHDLDYRDLARWNNIGGDYRISVGQVLILGPGGVPSPAHAAPSAVPMPPATAAPGASGSRSPRGNPAPRAGSASPPAATANGRDMQESSGAAGGAPRWAWPTDRLGAPRAVPGGGILLSGRLGQDVRAASAGRVVYAGSGLRGYGNLIIIKHADSLLSAYAHNRELLVHDGQSVAMGQVIAHMGEGAHRAPILYFEIRQNGRPVDPMPFFSKVK